MKSIRRAMKKIEKAATPKKSRKFDGKRYVLHKEFYRKGTADTKAKTLRVKGFDARVVKIEGGYAIYKRRAGLF